MPSDDDVGDGNEVTLRSPTEPNTGEVFAGALPRGTALGRYLLLEEIGHGGMGVVYAAYDPELNRRIAIKLIRTESKDPSGSGHLRKLLMREARAMARLSHPNVLAVYDVGTFKGQIFMAAELIDGGSLGDWLALEKRGWREVLDKFLQAGAGLEAAHRAGLLHRDFKPDNVLVGKNGRVYVTDFGLVRSHSKEGEEITSPGERSHPSDEGLIGTPSYMAPELLMGSPADERSDQFAFCVALYEGLYGERPFRGEGLPELAQAVLRGEIPDPPAGSRVPAAVRRVVSRGLRSDPAARFPSMSSLLAALKAAPRIRRTALAACAALVAVAGLATTGWMFRHQRQLCQGAERHLVGVWDPSRKATIHAAFARTGRAYAESTWEGVQRALDAYADGWVSMNRDACEATRVRGEQTEAILGMRMVCLDERLHELDATAKLFEHADAQIVERAIGAARRLTPLASCSDLASLQEGLPPIADERVKRVVDAGRAKLVDAHLLFNAGKYQDGLSLSQDVVQMARGVGYRPLEADALELSGAFQEKLGAYAVADATLDKAIFAADAARDDRARAWALVNKTLVETRLNERSEAERDGEAARAVIERLPNGELLESERLGILGILLRSEGRSAEAEQVSRKSIEIKKRLRGPDDPGVADALTGLGITLSDLGRYQEALAAHEEALEIRRRLLGPDHPSVGESLINASVALRFLGRLPEARQRAEEALRLDESVFGPEHPHLGTVLANLAAVEVAAGQDDAARADLNRAIAIREKALGKESPMVAFATNDLADLEAHEHHWEKAKGLYERALAIREKSLPKDHPQLADSLLGLGRSIEALGKPRDALPYLQRAVALRQHAPADRLKEAEDAYEHALARQKK